MLRKFVLSLITIFCALIFNAQAQEIKVVEKLSDGSYIVSIAGQELRALPAAKIRELAETKVRAEAAEQKVGNLQAQLDNLLKQISNLGNQVTALQANQKDLRAIIDHQNNVMSLQARQLERAESLAKKSKLVELFEKPIIALPLKFAPIAIAAYGATK